MGKWFVFRGEDGMGGMVVLEDCEGIKWFWIVMVFNIFLDMWDENIF